MRIFYTTKRIFWSNEGQDYLESTQFNEFFSGQWIELSNVKSINWTSHYEASFYATDAFEATYFKIEKNNQTYYFFVQDIKNDSANGKFWYLTLDLYNTYGKEFIERLKQENPKVTFKRKHCNRYFNSGVSERRFGFDFDSQRYLLAAPSHLQKIASDISNYPTGKYSLKFLNQGTLESIEPGNPSVGLGASPKYKGFCDANPIQIKESWEYLVIKRPGSFPSNARNNTELDESFNFFYLPINESWVSSSIDVVQYPNYDWPSRVVWANWEDALTQVPSDLVIGRIKTSIPPSAFKSCDLYTYLYPNPSNNNRLNQLLCLSGSTLRELTLKGAYNLVTLPDTPDYSNYTHEPIITLPPFTKMVMNDQSEITPLSFFKRVPQTNRWIQTNTLPWVTVASTSVFLRPPRGVLENENSVKYFVDVGHKIPSYGDVLNNYLLNNINAINTGMLTKVGSSVLGFAGSMTNITGSLLSGNISGAIQGGVGIGQSAWGLLQSFRQLEATKADLGNRADDLKDSYGKGVTVESNESLTISYYSLPVHMKQLVFKDIYFSGYLFNGVDNFNTYRNRTKFNYFEITDANQFLNLYTTYPKQIISDLSEKFLNGIRLWRTTAVNFDMTLDNREISFD